MNDLLEDTLTQALAGRATLALEDGRIFNGRAAGARTRRGGEVVFNTSLTGYQEVFTDPELLRADRLPDVSAYRQRRHESRR